MKAVAVGIVARLRDRARARRRARPPDPGRSASSRPTYVEVIRNTPILVQIFLLFYGAAGSSASMLEPFTVAWLSITIWGGAFHDRELPRGLRGRSRAAHVRPRYALGFTPLQAFLNVTLPIGGRIALPSTINTCDLGAQEHVAAATSSATRS